MLSHPLHSKGRLKKLNSKFGRRYRSSSYNTYSYNLTFCHFCSCLQLFQTHINLLFKMMKLILTVTLVAAAAMASDDGTSVHGDLIKDYCAADDAGRDKILIQLEGWCLAPAVCLKWLTYQQDQGSKAPSESFIFLPMSTFLTSLPIYPIIRSIYFYAISTFLPS